MRITQADLVPLNQRFEDAAPLDILRFAREVFGERAAILSSMQRAGTALCHMADRAGLDFDVLFVDTGVLHTQTLETRDALASTHRHLRIHTLHPERGFLEQTREEGLLYVTPEGQERCCDLRKTAPLRSVRGRYDALIGALRRGEGGARARVQPFALDVDMNTLRIHPLAHVTSETLNAYFTEHPDALQNPLHLMGFPTIGCFPCTTPVLPDEPERAGRWRHLASVAYCGINPTDRGALGDGVVLDDRYVTALQP
ncbi:phosphoadenylyl-sulfate reductase [Chondromyces crocatus]|uniref:Phosphoadenosine phosphosulfate reductase n=1 Tax=Chondromyces crocatus TaxID=52 RepID=A0A0K1E690_CHOCO|nr:phosphoadenylyl-sulfate reductase [Chondromyces crocatus]AKT36395.1 phosphoadenosine phosphosulfate reductase [Chondromyces crocatus]